MKLVHLIRIARLADSRAGTLSGYRVAAIATLSAAAAGITLLSGLFQLRVAPPAIIPGIALNSVPERSWPNVWLNSALSAADLQTAAMQEWLRLLVLLLVIMLVISAVSALVAFFAHATARRYETALAAALGATRAQLARAQLREAARDAGVAVVVGASTGLLTAYAAHSSWPHVQHAMTPLSWILASTLFTCAVAGMAAYAATRRMAKAGWLGDALAPEARTNPGYGAEDLRNVLLQLQFAFTFALLVVASLIQTQGKTGQTSIRVDQFVTRVTLADQTQLQNLEAKGYAISSPGVLLGVGESDHVLSHCGLCSLANMPLPFFALRTQQHVVGTQFFARTGLPLSAGREFEARDAGAKHIVVNDTFALLAFQGQPAVGKTVQVGGLGGEWYRVIGVVRDVPISALTSFRADPHMLVNSNQHAPGKQAAIYFYAQDKTPAVADVVSKTPINAASQKTTRILEDARAPAIWFGKTLKRLAIAAALIAAFSLAAITLLNVRQRQQEIAARRAVGARRRGIIKLVLGNTLSTVIRGAIAGVVLSIAIARGIQLLLPGMQLLDVTTWAIALITLTAVALAAAALPARAATHVAPAQAQAQAPAH